jgi:arylsulfatase A-like enzyme
MITGLYPSSHGGTGVDIPLPDDAVTLAEILQQRGYSTQGVVSNWAISRGNGFDDYHESTLIMQKTPTSEHVTAASVELLEKLAGEESPSFLFVHYFEPHFRYLPHPEIENLRDLYAEEIRHADGQVGALLDSVASLGLMDDAVIAIVSDHGEEIFDREN